MFKKNTHFDIVSIAKEQRTSMLIKRLLEVWNASVHASHHFLTEDDIVRLSPYAEQGMRHIHHLLVIEDEQTPVGFMGVQDRKIEMLFLHPDYFRKGLGKKLVQFAFQNLSVEFVDVNEQNPDATMFYKQMGFKVIKRNEYDGEGNPFPILEMQKTNA